MTLGPSVREGEQVFGVVHIFASFNDTFIVSFWLNWDSIYHFFNWKLTFYLQLQHVTDLSGRETLVRITGKHLLIWLHYNPFVILT